MTNKPKEILIILQPRAIPEAIESLNKLDIEKVWFRAFDEPSVCESINQFIRDTNYDYYWVIADDVIVSNAPIEKLRPLLYQGKVVTGYCKWHNKSPYANLLHKKIKTTYITEHPNYRFWVSLNKANAKRNKWIKNIPPNKPISKSEENKYIIYDINISDMCYSINEISEMKSEPIKTCFGGWSFTGASKEIWLKYPFQCSIKGCESDMNFAHRFVNEDGGIIHSHKDAYFEHLKTNQNILTKNWLVGVEPSISYVGQGKINRDEIKSKNILFQQKEFSLRGMDSEILTDNLHISTIEEL